MFADSCTLHEAHWLHYPPMFSTLHGHDSEFTKMRLINLLYVFTDVTDGDCSYAHLILQGTHDKRLRQLTTEFT